MNSASNYRSLEQFGILPLTGESDALEYRVLCDLTPEGVDIVRECFGFVNDASFARAWNSRGIASIMLSEDMIRPLAIMGFFLQGKTVVITDNLVYGFSSHENIELDESGEFYNYVVNNRRVRWPECYGVIQKIIRATNNKQTRNQHQATLRTV